MNHICHSQQQVAASTSHGIYVTLSAAEIYHVAYYTCSVSQKRPHIYAVHQTLLQYCSYYYYLVKANC